MARLPKIEEPKFVGPMSKLDMANALNWYHQNFENKDAQRFVDEYIKRHKLTGRLDTTKSYLTMGWLCRLATNGNDVGESGDKTLRINLPQILTVEKVVVIDSVAPATPTISIQDRLREKVAEIAGELDGAVDEYIVSGYKTQKSPLALMKDTAKGVHAHRLVEIFRKRRIEFDDVLNTTDNQIKEGYSNFTKPQLKKVIAYYDQIIMDALKIAGEAKESRKPRARKKKSADQLVSKMQFLDKFDELKLVSIPAKQVIGSTQLWVYNTKNKKLGVYHAEDAGGFGVKGSTLTNFNEGKSVTRTLRKPKDVLTNVMKSGKIALRNILPALTTAETQLTGRINKDTILLKVL
jgi:hypothetical protein